MLDAIKDNPVRLYAIAAAAVALVAHYVQDLPVALILALVAAVLGVGEGVRAVVTPTRHVAIDDRDLEEDEVPVSMKVTDLEDLLVNGWEHRAEP